MRTAYPPQSFDAKKEVTQVAFDRGENRVLAGTSSGAVKVWELESSGRTFARRRK